MKRKYVLRFQVICKFILFFGITQMEARMSDTLLVPAGSRNGMECECGKLTRKVDDERLAKVKIAGGRLPWLAEQVISDDYSGRDETAEFLLCFGTVVSLQTVLFPASCMQRNFYSNTGRAKPKVKLLGMNNLKEAIQDISSIRLHPGYRKKFDNDLALVKLRDRIDFNKTGVVPICLPAESRKYPALYPDTVKVGEGSSNQTGLNETQVQIEEEMSSADLTRAKKPTYMLEHSLTRTWFYRKAAGYDYSQFYGRFPTTMTNDSYCQRLFPEMLQSKVSCIQQREIRNIVKQNENFFRQLELGMPVMLSNTTLVKGKPQAATAKYRLEAIRSPGKHGVPMLEVRENTVALLKINALKLNVEFKTAFA